MSYEMNYHSKKLKEALGQKQKLNPSYSLRAFSKYLGMHPSTLSLVMKGKRPIPGKNLDEVIMKLDLTVTEEAIFRESLERKNSLIDKIEIEEEYKNRFIVDESHHKVLAEWEHYALLSLVETEGFHSDFSFIASRLDISLERLEVVIDNLLIAELIEIDGDNNIKLTSGPLRTTEDISSKALRASHKETLEMSKSKLDDVPVEFRDFSSMTIAVDPEKLPEAKAVIREFRQKMASLLRDGNKTEVFQFALQLYPLTDMNSEGSHENIH